MKLHITHCPSTLLHQLFLSLNTHLNQHITFSGLRKPRNKPASNVIGVRTLCQSETYRIQGRTLNRQRFTLIKIFRSFCMNGIFYLFVSRTQAHKRAFPFIFRENSFFGLRCEKRSVESGILITLKFSTLEECLCKWWRWRGGFRAARKYFRNIKIHHKGKVVQWELFR